MSENGTFRPIPTREIPAPVLEGLEGETRSGRGIPRIILQSVGSERATRRVLLLAGLFALVAAAELAILLRFPSPEPLVVYAESPRKTLVEEGR